MKTVAEAIEHASPVFARAVGDMCATPTLDVRRARRTVLSVVRYLLRMQHRATPFGLFAGVAPGSFGSTCTTRWGTGHRAVARARAAWLADVIERLESCPQLLARLPLVTNTLAFVRADRVIVPHPPQTNGENGTTPFELSLRWTAPVRAAVDSA